MVEIDPKRFKTQPYAHQLRGSKKLVFNPLYALFWEMRVGKTKAVIDAACILRDAGLLDAVLIVCPAQVKDVWLHKEVGELSAHCWQPYSRWEMNSGNEDVMDLLTTSTPELKFIAISHELLRTEDKKSDFPRAQTLAAALKGMKVWTVYDEASAFSNWKSLQTKSAMRLNELIEGRKTLLDGTPVGNSQMEQYSKFNLLGRHILGYTSFFHFRAAHQDTEPNIYARRKKKFVGFKNQDRIDKRVRPYCEYLEQKDCLDMPEKVPYTLVSRLCRKTWAAYEEMRDDMLAELECGTMAANHASVKVLRLAQLCAGVAGGIEDEQGPKTVSISHEADNNLLEWLNARRIENPGFKCVVWCRWRPQLEWLHENYQGDKGLVYGSKQAYDQQLHPTSEWAGSYVLFAQPQAMRYGVNLSRADTEVFHSQDYDNRTRRQAEERIQDPRWGRRTSLVADMLVEGPNGERTITWDIKKALDTKEDVARRTARQWKEAIQ